MRKPVSTALRAHPKVHEVLVLDLANLANDPVVAPLLAKERSIDAAVSTLGVNEPFGWKLQRLVDIELGLTTAFARFCRDKLDVKYFGLLSMAGTDRENPLTAEDLDTELTYWNIFSLAPRLKGDIETAVLAAGIPYVAFFRPAQFETAEMRFGLIDYIAQYGSALFNFVVPWEWHSIPVNDIGQAMFQDADQAMDEFGSPGAPVTRESIKIYTDMKQLSAAAAAVGQEEL